MRSGGKNTKVTWDDYWNFYMDIKLKKSSKKIQSQYKKIKMSMRDELPDLPEKEKNEIVQKAIEGCGQILLMAMKACKVENYITGSIINHENGNLYELTFHKKHAVPKFTCKHCGEREKEWSRKNDDWYCKKCGHIINP